MSNDEEVSRLLAAVNDALRRDFKIIACLPNLKDPYTKYSPHACHSGTSNPEIALLPWRKGEAANFGVACGESDLCVVDADHGLHSLEELLAWQKRNGLPVTLTARTGRRGDDWGFHLIYKGAVKTVAFKIDGVSGELKSKGSYVCGVGSRHPSGALYEYINDVPIAETPEFIRKLAKPKVKPTTIKNDADFPLVEEGQRNGRLTSLAGSLRNLGLTEVGILAGLEDFARNRCVDGDAYADANELPLRNMAHRAATWDRTVQGEIVFLPTMTGRPSIREILAANAARDARGEKI